MQFRVAKKSRNDCILASHIYVTVDNDLMTIIVCYLCACEGLTKIVYLSGHYIVFTLQSFTASRGVRCISDAQAMNL